MKEKLVIGLLGVTISGMILAGCGSKTGSSAETGGTAATAEDENAGETASEKGVASSSDDDVFKNVEVTFEGYDKENAGEATVTGDEYHGVYDGVFCYADIDLEPGKGFNNGDTVQLVAHMYDISTGDKKEVTTLTKDIVVSGLHMPITSMSEIPEDQMQRMIDEVTAAAITPIDENTDVDGMAITASDAEYLGNYFYTFTDMDGHQRDFAYMMFRKDLNYVYDHGNTEGEIHYYIAEGVSITKNDTGEYSVKVTGGASYGSDVMDWSNYARLNGIIKTNSTIYTKEGVRITDAGLCDITGFDVVAKGALEETDQQNAQLEVNIDISGLEKYHNCLGYWNNGDAYTGY